MTLRFSSSASSWLCPPPNTAAKDVPAAHRRARCNQPCNLLVEGSAALNHTKTQSRMTSNGNSALSSTIPCYSAVKGFGFFALRSCKP